MRPVPFPIPPMDTTKSLQREVIARGQVNQVPTIVGEKEVPLSVTRDVQKRVVALIQNGEQPDITRLTQEVYRDSVR